jgi:uncharacterized radical SAM superfamily Fe-S cluster-containing enzyme
LGDGQGVEGGKLITPSYYDRATRTIRIADREVKVWGSLPKLKEGEKLVRTTQSICPYCYALLPAIIFERDGKLYIRKECPEHGEIEELYQGSSEFARRIEKWYVEGRGPRHVYTNLSAPCPYSCGLCPIHKNHTALANLVLTNRCDLDCWYCLPEWEEVLFKINGEVKLIKLGELANKFSFEHKVNIDGFKGEYVVPENLYVLSIQDDKAVWVKVTKFLRRVHDGELIKLRTRSGREIHVTPEHKVIIDENGKLIKKRADEIKAGDKVRILCSFTSEGRLKKINLLEAFKELPKEELEKIYIHTKENVDYGLLRRLYGDKVYYWKKKGTIPLHAYYEVAENLAVDPELGRDATSYTIPSILELTPELGKIIGYFVADGHYTSKDLRITVGNKEVEEEIVNALKKLRLPYSFITWEGKAKQIVIGSRLMRLVFKYVFKIPKGAPNKRLPQNFMEFPTDVKIAMLSGLFNGDGFVEKGSRHLALGYASTSKELIRDILYLLESLGIFARVSRVRQEKNKLAKHDVYKLKITGKDLEKFVSMVPLIKKHRERLGNLGTRRPARIERIRDCCVDTVKEVSKLTYKGYVYDLEVDADEHYFIASDGILVSNCFFFAEKSGFVYEPTIEQIRFMVQQLLKQGVTPAVQLTGGEPTLRDDIVDIVRMLREMGVRHIQLNTNITKFAKLYLLEGEEAAVKFSRDLREAGVNTIYMSFDGVSPQANPKNHWEVPFALDAFRKSGMTSVVLVPTVIKGLNTHELGDIIKFAALNKDVVRSVNLQPVSLTGMIKKAERDELRVTIYDVAKLIEEQTKGQIKVSDWFPVPASVPISEFVEGFSGEFKFEMANHPECGVGTYVYMRMNDGEPEYIPITRMIDVQGFLDYLTEKSAELRSGGSKYLVGSKLVISALLKYIKWGEVPSEIKGILRKLISEVLVKHTYESLGEWHYKFTFLGMMHFMDLYNYDVERVMRCNVHYLMPDGRVVPFCTFNVLNDVYRDYVQKKYMFTLEEWSRMKGANSIGEAVKYRRNLDLIKKMTSHPLYIKTYKDFISRWINMYPWLKDSLLA